MVDEYQLVAIQHPGEHPFNPDVAMYHQWFRLLMPRLKTTSYLKG